MSTIAVSRDDDDLPFKKADEEELQRSVQYQKLLENTREEFRVLAEKDFKGNRSTLLNIYTSVLLEADAHYTQAYLIRIMLDTIDRLGLGSTPAAYGFGGYQKTAFTLPAGETEASVREKLLFHVPECAPYSEVVNGLNKSNTLVPWEEKAATLPLLHSARRADGSWDKALLLKLASEQAAPHQRVINHLIRKTGPWLIWYYPDPGDWLANWKKCRQFVRDFSNLDDSLRYSPHPFVFAIMPIDPSKATSSTPAPAASPAATAPEMIIAAPNNDGPTSPANPVYL